MERRPWALSVAHWSVSTFPHAHLGTFLPQPGWDSTASHVLLSLAPTLLPFLPSRNLCLCQVRLRGTRVALLTVPKLPGPLQTPAAPGCPLLPFSRSPRGLFLLSCLLLFLQTSISVPSGPHVVLTSISLRKPGCQRTRPEASTPAAQSSSAAIP